LLILAYVLNFVRDGLPCLILGAMDIEWGLSAADSFLLLDILHMAGISFLFMALLKKCKASIPVILIITLVMQVAGDLLTHYTDFSQSWLRYLLGYFFYTFDNSAFPIMQWFIYVALGYCFGYFLQRTLDKKRLYTLMFIIGVAYGALVIGIFLLAGVDMVPMFMADADYFHPNLIHHAFYLIAVLIILPVCYLLSSVIKWRPVVFCVNLLSKKVTVVYCIQWILIEWSSFILCIIGMNVIPQEWVLWYSAVVLVLSAALTVVYQIICKRIQLLKNNRSKKTA
ncbi:MAG: hypothetical protein ACI4QI_05200, partial [Candidatus Coproplasma sp.]